MTSNKETGQEKTTENNRLYKRLLSQRYREPKQT